MYPTSLGAGSEVAPILLEVLDVMFDVELLFDLLQDLTPKTIPRIIPTATKKNRIINRIKRNLFFFFSFSVSSSLTSRNLGNLGINNFLSLNDVNNIHSQKINHFKKYNQEERALTILLSIQSKVIDL